MSYKTFSESCELGGVVLPEKFCTTLVNGTLVKHFGGGVYLADLMMRLTSGDVSKEMVLASLKEQYLLAVSSSLEDSATKLPVLCYPLLFVVAKYANWELLVEDLIEEYDIVREVISKTARPVAEEEEKEPLN